MFSMEYVRKVEGPDGGRRSRRWMHHRPANSNRQLTELESA